MTKSAVRTANLAIGEYLKAAIDSGTLAEVKCALEQADAASLRLSKADLTTENQALYRLANIKYRLMIVR